MRSPNVWIIQNDLEKLQIALSTIDKTSPNNFLYTNCISHFNFDDVVMNTKNFNSFLHCQDSNTYIIFMKDNLEKINYTRHYLNQNNIQYHEISFKNEKEDIINRYPNSLHSYDKNTKEIWVVNNEETLISLLKKMLIKKEVSFYPLISSNIKLSYSNNSDRELRINKFSFEGIIMIGDEIILLEKNKNLNLQVKQILDMLNIKFISIKYNRPKFINIEEKRNKMFDEVYKCDKAKLLEKTYY